MFFGDLEEISFYEKRDKLLLDSIYTNYYTHEVFESGAVVASYITRFVRAVVNALVKLFKIISRTLTNVVNVNKRISQLVSLRTKGIRKKLQSLNKEGVDKVENVFYKIEMSDMISKDDFIKLIDTLSASMTKLIGDVKNSILQFGKSLENLKEETSTKFDWIDDNLIDRFKTCGITVTYDENKKQYSVSFKDVFNNKKTKVSISDLKYTVPDIINLQNRFDKLIPDKYILLNKAVYALKDYTSVLDDKFSDIKNINKDLADTLKKNISSYKKQVDIFTQLVKYCIKCNSIMQKKRLGLLTQLSRAINVAIPSKEKKVGDKKNV